MYALGMSVSKPYNQTGLSVCPCHLFARVLSTSTIKTVEGTLANTKGRGGGLCSEHLFFLPNKVYAKAGEREGKHEGEFPAVKFSRIKNRFGKV